MLPRHLFVETSNPKAVVEALTRTGLGRGADHMVMLLVASGDEPNLEALVDELGPTGLCFFGAVFPALLLGTKSLDRGVLAVALPKRTEPLLVSNVDTNAFVVPGWLTAQSENSASKPTAVVLVDGLTPHISKFLESLYHQIGARVSYWGGGAGTMHFKAQPCVFTREGVRQGGAVVALSSSGARLGVRHGWRELNGPLVATRTEGNVIVQLNWRPALDVYRATVQADSGATITAENFFETTNAYPFGIQRAGAEFVVRDPIAIGENGGLVCVGDVPENAVLSILKGEPDALIDAGAKAATDAHRTDGGPITHFLVADCVSRALFLGPRFSEELGAIEGQLPARVGTPLCGMLTLGEIASRGEGILEFFNKTAVVAALHEA